MKYLYRISADLILILHFLVVIIVLFGWFKPDFWYFYMGTLVATLLSDLMFGYCILSKWEFNLRKKIEPDKNYDFRWTTYYTYKFTSIHISNRFYTYGSLIFLILSLTINLYFRFLF